MGRGVGYDGGGGRKEKVLAMLKGRGATKSFGVFLTRGAEFWGILNTGA